MATSYSVNVGLSPNALNYLVKGGYNLYGFKAVGGGVQGGQPVVWFIENSQQLAEANTIKWEEKYSVYDSTTTISDQVTITASNTASIDLGQLGTISSVDKIITVTNGTQPTLIEIVDNYTPNVLTVGMCQSVNNVVNPLCAFPLAGNFAMTLQPIEKIVLFFATNQLNTGTVVMQSLSSAILIDMTGQTKPLSVSYDLTSGWGGNTLGIFTQIPSGTALNNYLLPSVGTALSFSAPSKK